MEFLKAMKVRLKELQSGSTPSKGKWSTVGSVERKALTIALKGGLLVVGKEVGSGGQGHVFAATHAGKQYALKQSSFAEGSRQERIAQADLEFGTSLQHECLQEYLAWTIQEAGVHPTKGKKLLMLKTVQLLAETDLHDALDKGAFHNSDGLPKLGKLLSVFHEVARGVAYLHGQRVVHCDLKHSNVLITGCDTPTPAARVCDFGLCVRLQNKEQEWCLGKHGRGTHGYIAPEIYPGVVMKDGRCMSLIALRSDVYSMGIMLWEALTLCAAASHSQSVSKEAPRVAPLVHPNFPRLTCFGPLEQFLVAQHGSEILQSLEKLISHMCHSDWQQRPDALSVVASMATLIGQVDKTGSAPAGKGQLSGSHSLSGALVPRRGLLGGKHKQKAGDSHKLQPEVKKQGTDKHKSSKKSSKKKKGDNPPPADSANTAPDSSTSHPASSTATSAGIQAVHAGATSAGIQAVHTTATSAAPSPNQAASVYNSPQIPTKILPASSATGAVYSSQSPVYEPPPLLPPLSRPAEPGTHSSISAAVGASLSGGNPAVPDWRAGNSTTSTGSTTRTPLLKAVHDQLEEAMSSLTSFRRSPQAAAALNTSPAAPSSGLDKPISGSVSSNDLAGDSGLVSRSGSSYTAAATKLSYEPLSVLASVGNGTAGAAGGGGSGSKSGRVRPGGILARWQQMMEERGILPAESDSSQPSTGVNLGAGAASQLHTADVDDNMAPTVSRPPRQDVSMPDSSGADGPGDSQHGAVPGDGPTVSRFGLSSRVLDAMSGAVGKPPMHPPPTGIGALREGSLTASVTELLRSSQESLSAMNAVSRRLAEREASLGVQQESSVEHPARMGSGLLSRNSGLSLRRSSSTFELQPAANGGSHQRLLSTGGSQFLSMDRPLLSEQIRWDSPSPTAHGAGMSTCSSMFDLDGVVGCTFEQSNGPPIADSVNISDSHFTMQSSVLYSLREARSEPTILSPRHKRPANTLSAGPSHTNTAYALITRPESLDLPCPPLPDLDSDFETTSFHSDFELSNASISDIRPALLYQPPFSPVAEVVAPTGPIGHPSAAASSSSSGPPGGMPEAPNQMLLSQISNPEFNDTAISTLDFDASVAFGPTGDNLVAPTGHLLQDRKHSTGQSASYSGMNCDTGTHRYSMHDSDSDTAISISFHTARVQPGATNTDQVKEHDLLLSSFRALRLKEDSTCSISSPPAKAALSSFQNSVTGTSDGAIIPSLHQNGSVSLPGAILASSQSLSG